jgi:hypothetical protein
MSPNEEVTKTTIEVIMDIVLKQLKETPEFDETSIENLRKLTSEKSLTNDVKVVQAITPAEGENEDH